jgi:hypothetical protein
MVDFSNIQSALQGGPVGVILALGFFVKLAAPGAAQLIDAVTRRDQAKRSAPPIAPIEGDTEQVPTRP